MADAPLDLDDNGWAVGAVVPFEPGAAFSVLAPDAVSRIDEGRWAHQARTFLGAELSLAVRKRYPAATLPIVDAVDVDVVHVDRLGDEPPTRVRVVTLPLDRAPSARRHAREGAAAIGGAGMDVLVEKGERLWQVGARVVEGADERAPLVVAALLASVFLGPIVPPEGGVVFGVKGARERLSRAGWRS